MSGFEQVKGLLKHSSVYGVGIVLSRSVGFFMLPVYTRYLSPSDYGILQLLDLIIFFSGIFAASGIQSAFFRFYSIPDDSPGKRLVASTAFLFFAGSSALIAALLLAAAPQVALLALGSSEFAGYVRIVALTLLLGNIVELPLAYLRAQGKTQLYVFAGLGRTIIGASLLALFVAGFETGVLGALWAGVLSSGIAAAVIGTVFLVEVGFGFSRSLLFDLLKYGSPLIGQSIGSFVVLFADRFFLRHFGSLEDVGRYALAYKIASIITVIVGGPFALAWQWQQFEIAKRDDARELFAKVQTYQFLVAMTIGVTLAVFARDVIRIMSPPEYWPAAALVPFVVLAYILADVRSVINTGIFVKRTTYYLPIISTVVAVISIGLNYLLVPRWMAYGAATTLVTCYAVSLVLSWVLAQRIYPVAYEYGRNLLVLALGCAAYGASWMVDLPLASSIAFNALIVAGFAISGFFILNRHERQLLRKLGGGASARFRVAGTGV